MSRSMSGLEYSLCIKYQMFIKILKVTHIGMYEELFGSEGVSQVYGLVTDWMNTLEPSDLKRIEWILYDDMCHLGKNKYDSSSIY